MRKMMLWVMVVTVAMLSGNALYAQDVHARDIAGDWQGTLKVMGPDTRLVLHVTKADKGGWRALLYDIDDSPEATTVTSITLQDSTFKFSIDAQHVTYEGKLSADGATIVGSWTEEKDSPRPLEFHRATKETAWPLPDPSAGGAK